MSYYFDVLPRHPKSQQLEAFSSYLIRLAEANRIRFVSGILGLFWENQSYGRDLADLPPLTWGNLPSAVVCSEETLLGTTFYYLGRKFGQAGNPRLLGQFLAGSVSPHLRYCPLCITEHSYYSLTWRFLCLVGCIEHHCALLERCGHCGQTIPLFIAPLRMGICPSCQGDLRTTSSSPLTEHEYKSTEICFKDLVFLLTHQSWESESDQVTAVLGRNLMALRQEKGVTQDEVADQLRMQRDQISHMEQGPKKPDSQKNLAQKLVSFHRYLAYTKYLGVTCTEVFTQALERKEEIFQFADNGVHGLRERAAVARAQEILAQVQQAVQDLRAQGQPVTLEAITQQTGLPKSFLSRRPQLRASLEQIGYKPRSGRKRGRQGEDEVLSQVHQAIKLLEAQGRSATLSAIQKVVRLPMATLLSYPQVWRLLEGVETQHSLALGIKVKQREDELVEKVQVAIRLLEARGQPITKRSIAGIVQHSVQTLRAYPRVGALWEEHVAKEGHQRQLGKARLREQELVDKVTQAIKQLMALGKAITQSAVSQLVGVSVSSLRCYPSVRVLLSQATQEWRQKNITEGGLREETLVTEVLKATEQVKSSERPVTSAAIAEILQRSLEELNTYPKIKSILEQVQEAEKARVQQIRRQLREAELLKQIEEAVYSLESSGQPITKAAVGQIIHVLPTTFMHFPGIQAFWTQLTARRHQRETEQKRLREGMLLKQVEGAIGLLVLRGQSVTQPAIQSLVGVSISALKKYPSVKLLLASLSKYRRPTRE
jgi:DNA-binding XRE family transcriptional regulator